MLSGGPNRLDNQRLADEPRPLVHVQAHPRTDRRPQLWDKGVEPHGRLVAEPQSCQTFNRQRAVVHAGVQFFRERPARSITRDDRSSASTFLGCQQSKSRTDKAMFALIRQPRRLFPYIHSAIIAARPASAHAAVNVRSRQ